MAAEGRPEISGPLEAEGKRFGIVAARFHQGIVDRLLEGAVRCLERHGAAEADILCARVPGAWEIPLALQAMTEHGDFDGLIALGVVIRGETPHFDYICDQTSAQCASLTMSWKRPIGFGLLTCETREQAEQRAGGAAGNKGEEAAEACLEMVTLLPRLRSC